MAGSFPIQETLHTLAEAAVANDRTRVEATDVSEAVRSVLAEIKRPALILKALASEVARASGGTGITIAPAHASLDPPAMMHHEGILVAVCQPGARLSVEGLVNTHAGVSMVMVLPLVGTCRVAWPMPPKVGPAPAPTNTNPSAAARALSRLTDLLASGIEVLDMLRYKSSDTEEHDRLIGGARGVSSPDIARSETAHVASLLRHRVPHLIPWAGTHPGADAQAWRATFGWWHLAIAAELMGMPVEKLFDLSARLLHAEPRTPRT
jgi:hypothetical protein